MMPPAKSLSRPGSIGQMDTMVETIGTLRVPFDLVRLILMPIVRNTQHVKKSSPLPCMKEVSCKDVKRAREELSIMNYQRQIP